MGDYARPASLDEALRIRASRTHAVLAGGTDFWPARVGRPADEDILDLTGISMLRGIRHHQDGVTIGAATTWTDVLEANLPPAFDCLREAAREVGGVQIQNAGTVAGNLCNASPAADGVPALLALGATVEVHGPRGMRTLPLSAFVTGPRRTDCAPDELVTAIHLPARTEQARSRFCKLGARRYLVISIAMVAVCIDCDVGGTVTYAGVAAGACSAVAQRLPAVEAKLLGQPAAALSTVPLTPGDFRPLTPIDDIRGTGAYRLEAVIELVARAIAGCAGARA